MGLRSGLCIVMLEGRVSMSLREGYHMREEDVFL
jgi:hypothetical protein